VRYYEVGLDENFKKLLGQRENDGGDVQNLGTLYEDVKMLQGTPPVQLFYTNKTV
jgi:hypothetical protein